MNLKSFCFIISGAIIQSIGIATIKIKMGASDTNLFYLITAILLILIGFKLYNLGMKSIKLSVAQPLFSTTLFLTSNLISLFILHETIRLNQILGTIIILVGVCIIIPAAIVKNDNTELYSEIE